MVTGPERMRATPCYHPDAYVETMRVVVDGDYDGLVWGTRHVLILPAVGSVGQFERRSEADRVLAAYHDPDATVASVWEARGERVADHPWCWLPTGRVPGH